MVPSIMTIIDKVQIGEASDHFIPVSVGPLPPTVYEGLIGMDFMAKFSMTVDHNNHVLVLEEMTPDPNSRGGHDELWWRSLFKMLINAHDELVKAGDEIDRKIRQNPIAVDPRSGVTFKKLKEAVDNLYLQNDRLYSRVERYANENSVPTRWRQ